MQTSFDCTLRLAAGAARGLVVALTTAAALAWAASPPATAGTFNLRLIDPAVADVPLGKDQGAVFAWLTERVERSFGAEMKAALDDHHRHLIRRKIRAEMNVLERSVVPFDGRKTGFEVSLVADEFSVGSGESLLVYDEAGVKHHLFFSHGRLWKYARALAPKTPFSELVAKRVSEHGQPTSRTGGGVRWEADDVTVRLDNHRAVFHADLLVVEHRALATQVAAARAKAKASVADESGGGGLDDFLLDTEGPESLEVQVD